MDAETDIEPAGADIPIVCTLTTKAAANQTLERVDLQHRAKTVVVLDEGVRMTFPVSMVDAVENLARRESTCCAFLTIITSVDDDVLTLDVSSESPEALPVI